MLHAPSHLQPEKRKNKKSIIEFVLQLLALIVTISIFLKATIDVDLNYDAWWYHLPFSGRIWEIVPKELFLGDDKWFEPRFEGFPLLTHFFQGFFWRVTGRIQSTNWVSFFSLLIYFFFLKAYCKVPLYLSAIALLAIPLVFAHASSSFVDLPGNIGASILVMMTYRLYQQNRLPSKRELLVMFFGAAVAANTKPQLQILVGFIGFWVGIRLLWLFYRYREKPNRQLLKTLPIILLASLLIFATPVKNVVVYGNPLYPVKITIAGKVLNHKLAPEAYQEGSRILRWGRSILEINSAHWSVDQWNKDPNRNRTGGFFAAYMIVNLLLAISLFIYEIIQNRQLPKAQKVNVAQISLLTMLIMSIIPPNFPQSHELRYFMFWAICLVSLNLSVVCHWQSIPTSWKWLQAKYFGLVCLVFLTIVISQIGSVYGKPAFYNVKQQIAKGVKPEFLNQIEPNDRVCLIAKHVEYPQREKVAALKFVFFYSAPFHPELNYSYSIKAVLDPKFCGDRKIIPSNIISNE
jgi:hypothetical protein